MNHTTLAIKSSVVEKSYLASLRAIRNIFPNDTQLEDPGYLTIWNLEKNVDIEGWAHWHKQNWYLPLVAIGIYLITIFGVQSYMKRRPAFDLRKLLIAWNLGFALLSATMFIRVVPAILFILNQPNGLHHSLCSRYFWNYAMIYWGIVYGFSKIAELGDTLFIVARKRKLTFLHYYHHVTVLCYVWLTDALTNTSSLWFGAINSGIHAVMYGYYATKAMQLKVPKSISMTITLLQLLQMVSGICINGYILIVKINGNKCPTETKDIYFAFALYLSYALLFGKFFVRAYFTQSKHNKTE